MAQRPNPQSIGICALIALYSDPNSDLHTLKDDQESPISSLENKVAAFLEESVFGIDGKNDAGVGFRGEYNAETNSDALATWIHGLKHRLGTQAAELLIDTLRMASESSDALMDLFESLKGAVNQGLVDATSLHGLYLRQHCLGFDELSFESTILLWQALKERISTIHQRGIRRTNDGDDGVIATSSGDHSPAWIWPHSTEQLQSILREDCIGFDAGQGSDNANDIDATMETNASQICPARNRKRLSFEEMEVYIRKMLKNDPELPVAHFLRYLNCLRHGERVGALDSLHEYFDHSMVRHTAKNRGGFDVNAGPAVGGSKDILQFSAILLAMTHSSFGDANLALLATEEAVRVAQQSKDAACVAFALGWLYENHGQGTAERGELLRRCASRASQGQLRPLVAGAQLALARHALQGGNSRVGRSQTSASSSSMAGENAEMSPQDGSWTTSWNHLLQVTAEPSTDHSGALDRPTYLSQNPNEVLESMATQRLVSAGIWDSLGMPTISKWASKVALNQDEELSNADLLAAIQNISRCALYGSPPLSNKKKVHHWEGHVGEAITERAVGNPLRPNCSYARAVTAMLQLRTELGLEGNDLEAPILQNLALILHEWAVNRGDTEDAIALQVILDSYLHPGLYNRDQLYTDIRIQKYLYFRRIQNWEKAKDIGNSLVKYCKGKGLFNTQAKILIQMGISELEADRKQCATALPPLLEALGICERWELHSLHAAAMSVLGQLFLRLQNPKRTVAIIEGTLPTLLQREHIWFQAEAYLTLAKAHLKLSTNTATDAQNHGISKQRCNRALQGLNKSMEFFEECQDRHRLQEVYYLQARIHALLRNTDKRDAMSNKFMMLRNAGGCNTADNGRIFDAIGDPIAIQALMSRSIY